MPTIGKPKPRFLKYVAKPDNVGAVELSQAQPVYIDGLPAGGEGGGAVDSVNGQTGVVELDATSVPYDPEDPNFAASSIKDILENISTVATSAQATALWAEVQGKPGAVTSAQAAGTASIRAIGTGPTDAAAGNHDHAVTADADSGLAAAANLQAAFVAISARVKALEDAAA